MLVMLLLTLADDLFGSLATAAQATTIDLGQGGYLQAVLSYCLQTNHFFPMDSYFTIALLYGTIYTFLALKYITNIVINLIPDGWGVRL